MRSMSRAASVESRRGSRAGAAAAQPACSPRKRVEAGRGPLGVAGSGSTLAAAAGDGPHSSPSLAPVPRSSKLTRSKSSLTCLGTSAARTGRISTPLSPGPPGLNRRAPRLAAGSAAGFSITGTEMVGPLGCA